MFYDMEILKKWGFGKKLLQDKLALKNASATYVKKGDRLTSKANLNIEILWQSFDSLKNSYKS
jgi:hypothetical protein